MRKDITKLPERKRLPYLFLLQPVRLERPEQYPHPRGCSCRHCKRYGRLLRKLRAIEKGRMVS